MSRRLLILLCVLLAPFVLHAQENGHIVGGLNIIEEHVTPPPYRPMEPPPSPYQGPGPQNPHETPAQPNEPIRLEEHERPDLIVADIQTRLKEARETADILSNNFKGKVEALSGVRIADFQLQNGLQELGSHTGLTTEQIRDLAEDYKSVRRATDARDRLEASSRIASRWDLRSSLSSLPADHQIDALFIGSQHSTAIGALNSLVGRSAGLSADQARAQSQYLDDQGILKGLPEGVVPIDSSTLQTDASSFEGRRIRGNINYLAGARARHWGPDNSINADFISFTDHVAFQLQVADALLASGNLLGNSLLYSLRQTLGFVQGVGNGAYNTAEGLGILAGMLYLDAGGTIAATVKIFTEYEETAERLKKFANDQWDEFIAASDQRQAEMIGSLAFEAAAVLVPPGAAVKALTASTRVAALSAKMSAGLTQTTRRIAEKTLSTFDSISGGASTYAFAKNLDLAKLASLSPTASQWAQKVYLSGEKWGATIADLAPRIENYLKLESKFDGITGIAGEAHVYRTIPKGSEFPASKVHPASVANPQNRFNHPGEPSLYGAFDPDTALKEAGSGTKASSQLDLHQFTEKYSSALDLTDASVIQTLGVQLDDLLGSNKILPQVIGSMARERGFDAILYRSAQTGRTNIVFFKDFPEAP